MNPEEREAILKLRQLIDIDTRATELLARMKEGLRHPKEVFDVYMEAKGRVSREREAALRSEKTRLEVALASERQAMETALRTEMAESAAALVSERAAMESALSAQKAELEAALASERTSLEDDAKRVRADEAALKVLVEQKCRGFPWLAAAYADYLMLQDLRVAGQLQRKSHPAKRSADVIREVTAERREAKREARILKYKVTYYEALFPWLSEYWDIDDEELVEFTPTPDAGDADPARDWLTPAEFEKLSTVERYQRALDHWSQRKKKPWEIGLDYERYVGYLREVDGCKVLYHGSREKLDDLGRDLIVEKDGSTEIIQCKCWRQESTVHEKHVFQLFGTTVKYVLEQSGGHFPRQVSLFPELMRQHNVSATLVTSTRLSDRAKAFALALNVAVQESLPLKPYPMIKCNVARQTGERVYHLPFDQVYDRTMVEKERNERYVKTVREAEQLGFRRAWRWRGSTPSPES